MTARLAVWMSLATLALNAPNLCLSAPPATPGQPITIGERFLLQSQSLGEMRSYQVHRPRNYDLDNGRYPVLLVLDGLEHFQHVSATVDLLSSAGKIPKYSSSAFRTTTIVAIAICRTFRPRPVHRGC